MTNLNIAVPADSKDTKFGTSDIMLAKDTAALIADAKRTALEGEKTTLLAPTYIDSDIKFEKDINLDNGELHIKLNFDRIDIPDGVYIDIMSINEILVGLTFDSWSQKPYITFRTSDDVDYEAAVFDKQCEIIVCNNMMMKYTSRNRTNTVYSNIDTRLFKLSCINDAPDKISYICEVFSAQFQTTKTSQLVNDCRYVAADEDGYLEVDTVGASRFYINNLDSDDPSPCIVFGGNIDISATDNEIYFPYNTYIRYSGDDTNYNRVLSLSDIASYYTLPIYRIIKSLPPRGSGKIIYMIKKTNPTDPNVKYDKYIYIDEDSAWEKIG